MLAETSCNYAADCQWPSTEQNLHLQNLTYYFSLAGIAALGAGTAYTFYSSQPCKFVLGRYTDIPQECTSSLQQDYCSTQRLEYI